MLGVGAELGGDEGHQGEDAAFAAVVGPHDEEQVLDGDDEEEGPEDEREDAEDVPRGGGEAVGAVEALAESVKGARADVAVDNAQGTEGERQQAAALTRSLHASHLLNTSNRRGSPPPWERWRPRRRFLTD